MEDFWKYAALSLVTVILAAQLKAKPDMAALLKLAACAMAARGALGLFAPVVSLLGELETLGDLDRGSLTLLLKAAGVGLTAEIAGAVCADAGCGSLRRRCGCWVRRPCCACRCPCWKSLWNLYRR